MRTQTYEALLSNPQHIAQTRAAARAIEQLGGKLEIHPTKTPGMALVALTLPEQYRPETIFPGLPFFPV